MEIIVKLSIVLILLISKKTDASLEDQVNLDINGMEINAIIAQVMSLKNNIKRFNMQKYWTMWKWLL